MDNPYQVVPSPTYGAPQPSSGGQPGQSGQSPAQSFGSGMGAALQQMFGKKPDQPGQPSNPQGLAAILQKLFGQQQQGGAPMDIQSAQQQSGVAMDQNGMQRGPITPTQTPDQPISNFNPNTTGSLY